jgi:hypothetical protein
MTFLQKKTKKKLPLEGVEPSTLPLQEECSAAELKRLKMRAAGIDPAIFEA